MLSTLEDGKIVKGLAGIPSEGPVLLVGNHMLLALDTVSLLSQMYTEQDIIVRGMAHPLMFRRRKRGRLPEVSSFDWLRVMGIFPVTATNLFKLFSSKSHVLLFPGGVREAFHRKVSPLSWLFILSLIFLMESGFGHPTFSKVFDLFFLDSDNKLSHLSHL
ncbi:hypothetical protein KIW84_033190 [Lathyrus oleraceus]|uniref:Acyltransferase n=1 Tax=Pisum sativum TaxID=3888 RepID=A0A9D4XXV7_PEA|nr:hypothetical protein KIW84_033190 [Pisum sativum]